MFINIFSCNSTCTSTWYKKLIYAIHVCNYYCSYTSFKNWRRSCHYSSIEDTETTTTTRSYGSLGTSSIRHTRSPSIGYDSGSPSTGSPSTGSSTSVAVPIGNHHTVVLQAEIHPRSMSQCGSTGLFGGVNGFSVPIPNRNSSSAAVDGHLAHSVPHQILEEEEILAPLIQDSRSRRKKDRKSKKSRDNNDSKEDK